MRNRSDQILDQWESDQEDQNNLAMASTIDMHMGQMFPNRKAAQDLAQRMAGVNTAGNFLRDLGAARLGTTQAARMGRLDPAEMLREKLVGSMTNRLGQVGQAGGPGSMSDVFAEFNPAMSLMGGQPYEPRQDPMAAFKDPQMLARLLHFTKVQNGLQSDPNQAMQDVSALFPQAAKGQPENPQQRSLVQAAGGVNAAASNPLLSLLKITPDTSPATISDLIQSRQSSTSPMSEEELQQIVSFARDMEKVKPGWSNPASWFSNNEATPSEDNGQLLMRLLGMKPGGKVTDAIKQINLEDIKRRQRSDAMLMNPYGFSSGS